MAGSQYWRKPLGSALLHAMTIPNNNNNPAVRFTTAKSDADLAGILALQVANRPEALTVEERHSQGFVSARHDVDLLRDMNEPIAHTIALDDNGNVVGYALTLQRTFDVQRIPYLTGLRKEIERVVYKNTTVAKLNYVLSGQVCVAKTHRGQGVFCGLYNHMCRRLAGCHDCIITAVSTQNPRSLRAHAKAGFVRIHQFADHGHDWNILLLTIPTVAGTPVEDEKEED